MKNLDTLRQEIDGIDREITALLERRMDICTDVGKYKVVNGLPVLDASREATVLEAKADLVEDAEKANDVQAVFETIMGCSRRQQQKLMEKQDTVYGNLMKKIIWKATEGENPAVIFQGQPGAYGEEAAMAYFGHDCDRTNLKSWDGVFRAIKEGFGDYGVIPIENSSTGSINAVYDLLDQFNCYIVGEQVVRVDHCLMVKPDTKLSNVTHVYSHEQGLLQCGDFLGTHGKKWERHEMANTALSAKFVAERSEQDCAAIASRRAAEIFGLEILQSRINDRMNNDTRFIVVAAKPAFSPKANKITLSFTVSHSQGSLYKVLEIFAYAGLNLVNLESRPVPERNWEYRFYVDLTGNLQDQEMDSVLAAVEEQTSHLDILGNYEACL